MKRNARWSVVEFESTVAFRLAVKLKHGRLRAGRWTEVPTPSGWPLDYIFST